MCGNLVSYPMEQFSKLIFYFLSIDLARRMKIVIPTLKNCLVIYERFKRHILCFELYTVEKYDVLERGFFEAAGDESFFRPWPSCFAKRNEKK